MSQTHVVYVCVCAHVQLLHTTTYRNSYCSRNIAEQCASLVVYAGHAGMHPRRRREFSVVRRARQHRGVRVARTENTTTAFCTPSVVGTVNRTRVTGNRGSRRIRYRFVLGDVTSEPV